MLNHETGDIANVVKLFLLALLTVVVIAVSAAFAGPLWATAKGGRRRLAREPLVPVPLGLHGDGGGELAGPAGGAGTADAERRPRGCLVIAIAALGMKTSFAALAKYRLAAHGADRRRDGMVGGAGIGCVVMR